MRNATISRTTLETQIRIALDLDALNLDSQQQAAIATGHGFLDHMLAQVQKHGRLQLEVAATGDLHIDVHHLAEDTGITLGQAFKVALGDMKGIERYADAFVPMDETLAHVVLDFSGRPWISFDPTGYEGDAGGFNVHHLREFLRGFANHAGVTMHVRVLAGVEVHHVCEAITKAFARCLYLASRQSGEGLPSTKGLL